jgi:hypothetical protein
MRPAIPFVLILMLAACADPHAQCVKRANAELTAIDREMAEIQTTLSRGYRVSKGPRATVGFALCTSDDPLHLCLGADAPVYERHQAIDPAAEQARLRALQARRPQAASNAARAQTSCPT